MGKIRFMVVVLIVFVSSGYLVKKRVREMAVARCSSELKMTHKKRRMQLAGFADLYAEDPSRFRDVATRLTNIGHVLFGESSESYLVKPDGTRFTETRFEGVELAGQKIDDEAVSEALGGRSGELHGLDHGVAYYRIYSPLDVGGDAWGFITEIDEAELAEGSCGI